MIHRTLDGAGWLFLGLGVVSLANALWMLVGPMHWYHDLPVAVPDTGPFNAHFVRDIGCAFLTVGTALVWAAIRPALRLPLVAVATLFLTAHAILHLVDTLRGALGHHHFGLELVPVYAPAVLLVGATWRLARAERTHPPFPAASARRP